MSRTGTTLWLSLESLQIPSRLVLRPQQYGNDSLWLHVHHSGVMELELATGGGTRPNQPYLSTDGTLHFCAGVGPAEIDVDALRYAIGLGGRLRTSLVKVHRAIRLGQPGVVALARDAEDEREALQQELYGFRTDRAVVDCRSYLTGDGTAAPWDVVDLTSESAEAFDDDVVHRSPPAIYGEKPSDVLAEMVVASAVHMRLKDQRARQEGGVLQPFLHLPAWVLYMAAHSTRDEALASLLRSIASGSPLT